MYNMKITVSQVKIAVCLEKKIIHKKVWDQISESTSSQLMFNRKNSRTSLGFLRENISKLDFRLPYHNLAMFVF